MSDSMERDKIELLTSKEREEEEEMKRELLDMKMYETWYTYKDMKEILGFINESKDMANMANDEKNAQKELIQSSSDCSPEVMLKTNLIQELEIQEHINNTSQSIHSHRSNHTSPIHERTVTHDCSNSDLASAIVDSRNSVYTEKNLDSEDIFIRSQDNSNMRDSYSHNMSRYISLKSKSSSQDSDIINNSEKKMDIYSECDKKLDQWQINPLDSCVSENDVPLQEPNRPIVQDRMPFRLCKDAQTPEMLEKLLPALNFYLKQTAELWHSWHRTTDTKFQWGSPIQVGLIKDNLDKKSITNIKTEQNEMECINKYSNERPNNKRKSTMIFSFSDPIYSSSDEDEYTIKKKKIQSYEDKNKELSLNKMIYTAKCNEKNKNLNHDNISKFFDNKEIEHFKMECKKSKDCLPSELPSLCPKKIIPQIRKNINKNIKHVVNMSPNSIAHSSNEKKNSMNLISKDKNNILTDEEILIELEKDNEKAKTTFENIEIKPLPIKNFSYRIKNECITLEKLQLEKQKKFETQREKAQKKEIEEKKKKEELYKKQIEEEQKKEKQREEKEKDKEEKNKRWNIVYMKSKKKISKKDEEKLLSINKQNKISIDNRLLEDENTSKINEIEIMDNNLSNNTNCPICNKFFANDKIEIHAAGCEQYISENEYENDVHLLESKSLPIAINNAEILECGVCSKYKTTNGIHYEEHVNTCLQRQHEEESLNEYSSNEFSNIPNSPVRCYRPISEQTDSYIDYRRQFPSNSKTQIYSSRKRKR